MKSVSSFSSKDSSVDSNLSSVSSKEVPKHREMQFQVSNSADYSS